MRQASTVSSLAHRAGMKAYLYVAVFDHGRPLPPRKEREVSYHNAMHGKHVSSQSAFSKEHPEYIVVDREGWGVAANRRMAWGVAGP